MVMLTFANMAHVSRALVQMSRVGGRDENRYGSAPRWPRGGRMFIF